MGSGGRSMYECDMITGKMGAVTVTNCAQWCKKNKYIKENMSALCWSHLSKSKLLHCQLHTENSSAAGCNEFKMSFIHLFSEIAYPHKLFS